MTVPSGPKIRSRRAFVELGVLAPAVLLANLRLLLWCEVVDDVELFADLLSVLALDHGRHLGASEVQQALDVQVVRREDELEEDLLLDVDILSVPLGNSALDQVGALQ